VKDEQKPKRRTRLCGTCVRRRRRSVARIATTEEAVRALLAALDRIERALAAAHKRARGLLH
jgi:predicted phage tail protein